MVLNGYFLLKRVGYRPIFPFWGVGKLVIVTLKSHFNFLERCVEFYFLSLSITHLKQFDLPTKWKEKTVLYVCAFPLEAKRHPRRVAEDSAGRSGGFGCKGQTRAKLHYNNITHFTPHLLVRFRCEYRITSIHEFFYLSFCCCSTLRRARICVIKTFFEVNVL